jgi:7,8-dihydro-6-hydroxymethylpterin dimethyltransferase
MRQYFYRSVRAAADAAWTGFQWVNRRIPAREFHPAWAPEPLPKSHQRTKPPLGYPRRTDSLCPTCTKEVRDAIVGGTRELRDLIDKHPGEIPADIVQRGNEIWMVKTCPKHGTFEDLMSSDAVFFGRLEENFFGRDVKIAKDTLHDHGSSSIKYGRGAVLTVDLTNRCNMMCNPCFMDANQVGYVHELTWDDIKEILDNAISIKPRRQLSVQFSGGEPTISPFFLEATRYAKEIGYFSVQCATNGIRFAQEPEFARAAYDSGLRLAYLQFDGVGNEHNQHRQVGNLYDVKLRALDNLNAAKIDVTLVTTIINSVNNDQIGAILKFAIANVDKINAVSFQPVSFTGRDEDIDESTRKKQRYTLSHLAHDIKTQAGVGEPMRDWFPLSASGPFSDLKDLLGGLEAEWGSLKCGCHPNCGIGTMMLVHPESGQAVPVTQILDADRLLRDLTVITDAARGRFATILQTGLAVARNIRPDGVPKELGVWQTLKVMDGHTGKGMGIANQSRYPWRVLLVAGMWFQDLFNYDFRRTEMCIIPYGTQLGEISFCAYNTGAGWRKIIEEMFQSATLSEWYKDKGRHPVYAGGKRVPLPAFHPGSVPSTLPTFDPQPEALPAAARTATPLAVLPSFSPAAGK